MRFTFDPPETGWTLNASAQIVANASAPSPPNVLQMTWGVGSDPTCRRTLTGLTVGQSYSVWVRCNFDGCSTRAAVVRILYRDGNSFDAYLRKSTGVTGWELRYIGTLVYDFADRQFQIVGLTSPGLLAVALVDTIYIGETPADESEMGKSLEIVDAVLARLGTVKVANAYPASIGEVVFGTVRVPDEAKAWPHVQLVLTAESKTLRTLGRKTVTLMLQIGVFCRAEETSDPQREVHLVKDSIEMALEIGPGDAGANGQWLGLGYVSNVFYHEGELDTSPPEVKRGVELWAMAVEITFTHDRGDP
jgi:hypothetical protein